MTIQKDIKQVERWKVGNEAFIWKSLLMPEMSGKFKSNPTITFNLIYIMGGVYFSGGGVKKKNFLGSS